MIATDYIQLIEHYRGYKKRDVQLVLVTVVETIGSTYRKAGAHMLISEEGISHGLVSGGCLEGNLLMHAQKVLQTGNPAFVEYDLTSEDEGPWGLSIGCNGVVRLVLQHIDPADPNNLLENLIVVAEGHRPAKLAICAQGSLGQWYLLDADESFAAAGLQDSIGIQQLPNGDRWMVQQLKPLPQILVLGAGPDVPPLLQLCHRQGWRVTLVDHRPTYLQRLSGQPMHQMFCVGIGDLAAQIDLGQFDAAILMSHHLAADQSWLGDLLPSSIAYIGLLGPRARAEMLLENLGREECIDDPRLRAPVGLDIGGEGAEAIALSIVAQLQSLLSR